MTATVNEKLVDEARDGSVEALEQLLESVWPDAYRIAYSIVRDRTAAEDAAQESCATVYRSISTLRTAGAFRVWFYRIVAREGLRQSRMSAAQTAGASAQVPPDRESRLDIARALETLSPDLRAAVVLHYYADLTSREIAEVLGLAAPTVRFRLMLARRRLKPLLAERFPTNPPQCAKESL
jgi:RNA polymerase sigma-70 factor (ECF subfamily)